MASPEALKLVKLASGFARSSEASEAKCFRALCDTTKARLNRPESAIQALAVSSCPQPDTNTDEMPIDLVQRTTAGCLYVPWLLVPISSDLPFRIHCLYYRGCCAITRGICWKNDCEHQLSQRRIVRPRHLEVTARGARTHWRQMRVQPKLQHQQK